MKAVVINSTEFTVGECEIESFETYDGMYIKAYWKDNDGKQKITLSPAAYYYPIESRNEVTRLMNELRESKSKHDKLIGRIFYQDLPKLRGK